MYSDVGRKIRGFAIFCGVFIFIVCAIVWIVLITNTYETYEYSYYGGYDTVRKYITADDGLGWGVLGAGVIYLLSSWVMYGFGQMVDDVEGIYGLVSKISKKMDPPAQKIVHAASTQNPQPATPATTFTQSSSNVTLSPKTKADIEEKSYSATFCVKCGKRRADGAVFCQSCGNKFD